MLQIKKGKVLINIEGKLKETSNPEIIGLAVLDIIEKYKIKNIILK